MKIKERITGWLKEMTNKYNWIVFKYEYSEEMKAHLICTYPQSKIDQCDDYSMEEVNFNFHMDKEYPNEVVLFSTEDALFSCSENAKIFENNTSLAEIYEYIQHLTGELFQKSCDYTFRPINKRQIKGLEELTTILNNSLQNNQDIWFQQCPIPADFAEYINTSNMSFHSSRVANEREIYAESPLGVNENNYKLAS